MSRRKKNIIVSFVPTNTGFMMISTFSEDHRKSQNFYLSIPNFLLWLNNSDPWGSQYMEMDIHNVFRATHGVNGKVEISIYWIGTDSDDGIRGYLQRFSMNKAKLIDIMNDQEPHKVLACTELNYEQAKINVTQNAQTQIKKIICDKKKRRALSKALSCNFFYGSDETVDLYASWGSELGFSTSGLYGGLVLHDAYVIGYDGKHHQKLYYSVHT